MSDLISRQAAIDVFYEFWGTSLTSTVDAINQLPPVQPTQLTDDDIETIRVHLSAIKENLCNQNRWNEAKEYEALIDRLTAQPEQRTGKWEVITRHEHYPSGKEYEVDRCPFCHRTDHNGDGEFCGYCGAKMKPHKG